LLRVENKEAILVGNIVLKKEGKEVNDRNKRTSERLGNYVTMTVKGMGTLDCRKPEGVSRYTRSGAPAQRSQTREQYRPKNGSLRTNVLVVYTAAILAVSRLSKSQGKVRKKGQTQTNHFRSSCKVGRVLSASVEHDKKSSTRDVGGWHIELVVSRSIRIVEKLTSQSGRDQGN
jgi:hypothetical protein